MTENQTINFKSPKWIIILLNAALKKEKEKYTKSPVKRDLVPEYESVEGWGYVVAGYSLVELSLKALLYVRKKERIPPKHHLFNLFSLLSDDDKKYLREFYKDYQAAKEYQAAIGGMIREFPFRSIDDFLKNLDGNENQGSFDWRYFIIEEKQGEVMPMVSIDYLHEIIFGCIRIIESVVEDKYYLPDYYYSLRMHHERYLEKYRGWINDRINSSDWNNLGDRLEILWGPDYCSRYDLLLIENRRTIFRFSKIPDNLNNLPVIDKRMEF